MQRPVTTGQHPPKQALHVVGVGVTAGVGDREVLGGLCGAHGVAEHGLDFVSRTARHSKPLASGWPKPLETWASSSTARGGVAVLQKRPAAARRAYLMPSGRGPCNPLPPRWLRQAGHHGVTTMWDSPLVGGCVTHARQRQARRGGLPQYAGAAARRRPWNPCRNRACSVRPPPTLRRCAYLRYTMPSVVTVGRPDVPTTTILTVCLALEDQVFVQIASRYFVVEDFRSTVAVFFPST